MCRSIVRLRGAEPATDPEVAAAALQFVRKVSGSRVPSRANEEAFDRAVLEIAEATRRLLGEWVVPPGSQLPSRPPAAHGRSASRAPH